MSEIIGIDDCFKEVANFKLTIPEEYKHGKQLELFKSKNLHDFYAYDSRITDENFSNASRKLFPGKPYTVKIFRIAKDKKMSFRECMAFLKTQKNLVLVSAQGLSLVWEICKEVFLPSTRILSLDAENYLFKDKEGSLWIPAIMQRDQRLEMNKPNFSLVPVVDGCHKTDYECFLCFYK